MAKTRGRRKRFRFVVDVHPDWAQPGHDWELLNSTEEGVPWVMVTGGGLELSAYLQLGWSRDERLIATRLTVGTGIAEITSQALRTIPVAAILAQFAEDYDIAGGLDFPEGWSVSDANGDPREDMWFVHKMLAQRVPKNSLMSHAGRVPFDHAPDSLEAFACAYNRFLLTAPHRAMTATANALGISRATANRRAAECRKAGLIRAREGP